MTDEEVHAKRFALSLRAIRDFWQPFEGARVIDIGTGHFPPKFRDAFNIMPESTEFHLSYKEKWQYLQSDTYDLVICMEVLEHLSDAVRPEWTLHRATAFEEEGPRVLLPECYRILKPGGKMFLTTPNIAGWNSIGRILVGLNPMQYSLHNREYTFDYLIHDLIEPVGFSILKAWTEDPYSGIYSQGERDLVLHAKLMLAHQIDSSNRGEVSFVFCQKP